MSIVVVWLVYCCWLSVKMLLVSRVYFCLLAVYIVGWPCILLLVGCENCCCLAVCIFLLGHAYCFCLAVFIVCWLAVQISVGWLFVL